jgi:ParB/RepB/Spo0J family partition protein
MPMFHVEHGPTQLLGKEARMSRDDRPRLGRGLASLIRNSTEPDPVATQPAGTDTATHTAHDVAQASATATGAYVPVQPGEIVTHHQPQPAQPDKATGAVILPISSIEPNPSQPRRTFNEQSLAELAESIRTHGLLQPVVVSQMQTSDGQARYHLIAGERRWRAAKLAGVAELPCILRPASRQQMLELALIENIHRDDLNPIERAHAYRQYMDRFNLTQADAAQRLGQARATVANFLRILDLCDEVQELVLEGAISLGHAKVLAGLAG